MNKSIHAEIFQKKLAKYDFRRANYCRVKEKCIIV